MQRAMSPPIEWATTYTFGAPVRARTFCMKSYRPAAVQVAAAHPVARFGKIEVRAVWIL
jgi:hypothetical protein